MLLADGIAAPLPSSLSDTWRKRVSQFPDQSTSLRQARLGAHTCQRSATSSGARASAAALSGYVLAGSRSISARRGPCLGPRWCECFPRWCDCPAAGCAALGASEGST
jgi:hypothetical protein